MSFVRYTSSVRTHSQSKIKKNSDGSNGSEEPIHQQSTLYRILPPCQFHATYPQDLTHDNSDAESQNLPISTPILISKPYPNANAAPSSFQSFWDASWTPIEHIQAQKVGAPVLPKRTMASSCARKLLNH